MDLDSICDQLDVEVAELKLGASRGGAQGFLIPKRGGGFRAEIDPEPRCGWKRVPTPARDSLRRHRTRFLLCHELAHTVFYEARPDGARRVVGDSDVQEAFCDELARALLVPRPAATALPLCPESVLALQRMYDVSMEIALRSAITAHASAVGWLLLHRGGETRIQWTSAKRRLTAKALPALRKLSKCTTRSAGVPVRAATTHGSIEGVYMTQRDQVIVTMARTAAA